MLPPETNAVWQFLKDHKLLKGFVLLGGTALSLRIQHRISEDLDFCFNAPKLPRKRLEVLVKEAEAAGFQFEANDDPGAWEEFERVEMDLNDYQQDFLVNGSVKVTFFTSDSPLSKLLPADLDGEVRIATLAELFDSKAIVSSQRSKSRDWFDLYHLIRFNDFDLSDYANAFKKAGIPSHWETGLARIISGKLSHTDEGYEELMHDPPLIIEIVDFFTEERNRYEVEQAEKKFGEK